MATVKKGAKSKGSSAKRPGTAQVQIRMPVVLAEALDAYVAELNAARTYPQLTRTDVVLGALDWVIRTRAPWESRGPAPKPEHAEKGEAP